MWEIWANLLLPKALKSCPKSNKSPNLVTLHEERNLTLKHFLSFSGVCARYKFQLMAASHKLSHDSAAKKTCIINQLIQEDCGILTYKGVSLVTQALAKSFSKGKSWPKKVEYYW